jgi:pyridoxamine 5'-phosphate oxidase
MSVDPQLDPLHELGTWIEEAREAGVSAPAAATFATADAEGRPSVRTVTLKRIELDALVFTSALWTRKAREVAANPHVAVLFFWPELGRQAQVVGTVGIGDRALAEELWSDRNALHRLQTVVSRQGDPIDAEQLETMRDRLAHLAQVEEAPPACPEDWGALLLTPEIVEFWDESPDRLHERRLLERSSHGWASRLLSP